MKILQVTDNFINLDKILKIVIEDDANKVGVVLFKYKDKVGDWYTTSLKRKNSLIAKPLTSEMVKGALTRSVQYFETGKLYANLADFLD